MLAAGNDSQFRTLCSDEVLAQGQWAEDERFVTNQKRVENREVMVQEIEKVLGQRGTEEWCERLKGKG